MAMNRIQAARLLTAPEMALFQASLADELREMSAAQLRTKIGRARSSRDKFSDLFRRQSVQTRQRTGSKSGATGVANERSAQKAQVFSEVLQRFEKRLAQLEAAQARAASRVSLKAELAEALKRKTAAGDARGAARAHKRSSKAPSRGPSGQAGVGPTSESALTARHVMDTKKAGVQRVLGHVSSQQRRSQARRDGRG